MKVKPIYYKGFVNFLHIPESDEERAALIDMAVRSKPAEAMQELNEDIQELTEAMQELIDELERKNNNGNL